MLKLGAVFEMLSLVYSMSRKDEETNNSIDVLKEISAYRNKVAFMEISYFDESTKNTEKIRPRFQLFFKKCPRTCLNFAKILEGFTDDKGRLMEFKKSFFHRIIKGFMMQGGDFNRKNGTGGFSIYGNKFEDEDFSHRHKRGVLSMANAGPNTNGSQFFITFVDTPHLDRYHVVFGEVLQEDLPLIDKIQNVSTNRMDRPIHDVIIENCGFENSPNVNVL